MHVEELGVLGDGAHGGELAGARDVEGVDADIDERAEDEVLAVGLYRVGGLAGKGVDEGSGVGREHGRAKAIDGRVRPERQGRRVP